MPVSLSYGNVNDWGARSAPTVLRQSFGATVGGAGAFLPVSRPDRTGLHWGAGGGTLRPSAPRTTGFRTGNDAPAAGDIAAIVAWWRSNGPTSDATAPTGGRPHAGDATAPSAPHNGAWQAMAVKVAKDERWSFVRADRCAACLAEWEARENKAKEAWARFENGEGASAVSFQMWEDPHTGERSFTRIRETLPSGRCGNPSHPRVKAEAPESAPITVQEWETTLSQNPETGAFEFKRGPARCRTRHTGGRIAPHVAPHAGAHREALLRAIEAAERVVEAAVAPYVAIATDCAVFGIGSRTTTTRTVLHPGTRGIPGVYAPQAPASVTETTSHESTEAEAFRAILVAEAHRRIAVARLATFEREGAAMWHGPQRAPIERPVADDAPDTRVRRTALESTPRVVDGDAPLRAYLEQRHETAEKLATKVCRECKRATCRAVLRGTPCPYANGRKQPSQAKPAAPVAPPVAPSAPRYRVVSTEAARSSRLCSMATDKPRRLHWHPCKARLLRFEGCGVAPCAPQCVKGRTL